MMRMQAFGDKPGGGGSKPICNVVRWTDAHTKLFHQEVERRFRARTPPKRIDETDLRTRVNRAEMRSWALKRFGIMPPELDLEWGAKEVRWQRRMIRRVLKETNSDEVYKP